MSQRDEFDQSRADEEPIIDRHERAESLPLGELTAIFRAQLLACLEAASGGRLGLFGSRVDADPWPETEQLRQLAMALETLHAQQAHALDPEAQAGPDPDALLVAQFLDLCSIHGESHPGEARLAREFLREIAGESRNSKTDGRLGERQRW